MHKIKLKSIIEAQAESYPLMQPQDLIKLCYQACFGAGHMYSGSPQAQKRLMREYEDAKDEGTLFEVLPGGYARLNLGSARSAGVKAGLISAIFAATAADPPNENAPLDFSNLIKVALSLAGDGMFGFSRAELESYINCYFNAGQTPTQVSHSEVYQVAYKPHYRVIDERFIPIFDLCKAVYSLPAGKRSVIAIDGRCASGKTTAAKLIVKALGGDIVHCDDFFLPKYMRTAERLAEPGGNIDYKRFTDEVLAGLSLNRPFKYGVFSCAEDRITGTAHICGGSVIIVEGAYSTHPRFGKYYYISAFFDTDPQKQRERIIRRGGPEAWQAFKEKWIPLEESYITAADPVSRASFIVKT